MTSIHSCTFSRVVALAIGTPFFAPQDSKFFCADDYVKEYCDTCRHCKGKITSGSVIQAFGGYYHPHHFVCATCEKPFNNGKYYELNDQPYCEDHYFTEKCDACGKPVQDSDMVRVQGKSFHNTCLSCHHCKAPLAQQRSIFQKDEHVYCREDYLNLFCKRCTACSDHILKHCISVNDEYYHPGCLKCSVCSKKLDKYICIGGHLRCATHRQSDCPPQECSICSKQIEGEVVLAVGKKCHQECFKCEFCHDPLKKSLTKLREGKLCCVKCMVKKEVPSSSSSSSSSSSIGAVSVSSSAAPSKRSSTSHARASNRTSSSSSSHEPMSKTPIQWKKGDLIGKGSFGKVFLGMNTATAELIAVKQVRIQSDEDSNAAAAIEGEIKLMEGLQHPNIVMLLGTERVGNRLNILMEYVPGKSLDTLLDKFGAFSEKVIRSYTDQLLHALVYCHEHNVVHRDIKGKNILVDTQGNLKLADFGSAKRFENVMGKDAPSLSYNYTPLWTAPEVLVGNYNAKVDVWSMGCVIIEMLTSKPPWAEQNFENPFRALYHIGNTDSIPQIPENISAVGHDFIKCCLTRDPDKRPSSRELLSHEWLKMTGNGNSKNQNKTIAKNNNAPSDSDSD
jgi:predicted Ser/Thr protein kinase